jgi:amino acid permease
MEGKNGGFWRGVRPYFATVVGVGIFGLPFAVSAVGVLPGLAILAVVGGLNAVMLGMYAELLVAGLFFGGDIALF